MKKAGISVLTVFFILCLCGIGRADLVDISVATDKTTYQIGEEVKVYVSAYNPSVDPITLSFVSSLQATYWMDESYYWHENEIISPGTSYVMINPNSAYTWELVHDIDKISDYPLSVGEHYVIGYVLALELQNNNFTDTIYFEVIPEPYTIAMITVGLLWLIKRPRNRFNRHR